MKLTDAFCNFVNAPKNSNYTTKVKEYNYVLLLLLLLLAERFDIRSKWSSGVSRDISFSGQFTPLETASCTNCNEDGLLYTVHLVTK
jgi:hypothetical protein